eukprot:6268742-Amphidinium_carterae.1
MRVKRLGLSTLVPAYFALSKAFELRELMKRFVQDCFVLCTPELGIETELLCLLHTLPHWLCTAILGVNKLGVCRWMSKLLSVRKAVHRSDQQSRTDLKCFGPLTPQILLAMLF